MTSNKAISTLSLLLAIRDSHLVRNADRQLLDAFALRGKPDTGHQCWPSYDQLSLDTGLHIVTLKKAVSRLVKAGLISRKSRGYTSNVYTINVGMIMGQAEANREAIKAKKDAAHAAPEFPSYTPVIQGIDTGDSDDQDETCGPVEDETYWMNKARYGDS
jgi:hypothetical protein